MSIHISAASRRVVALLSHKNSWRIVLGLFIFESLWLVYSAHYPMAFDENYHFGLIQFHAQQWVPFFTSQPDDSGTYGAIVRDPSYLYHWLMSFPYRLISVFTTNQTAHIIFLRMLNVTLFTYGLVLYRRILHRLGVSNPLSTAIFTVFILIPVVPFLAATINYDNLFFVSIGLTVLLALKLLDGFAERRVDAYALLLLIPVLFLSSLVKYPYLPVFAVTAIYLVWRVWRSHLLNRVGWRSFITNFKAIGLVRRVVIICFCLLAIGLFAERYGPNIVTYHNPVPACNAVISEDKCIQYGPYGRDAFYKQQKPTSFHANIFVYAWQWLFGMWYRLFFAINSDYATMSPLAGISMLAAVLCGLLTIGIIVRFRQLFAKKTSRQFVLLLVFGYMLILFADGYSAFSKTGQPVAINGRYLIPFLPFILAFGGLAWSQLLATFPIQKAAITALVLFVFLTQGGGTMTYIIRSSDSWMWSNSIVRTVNHDVRDIAWSFVLGKSAY